MKIPFPRRRPESLQESVSNSFATSATSRLQHVPVEVDLSEGGTGRLMIDLAMSLNGRVIISGWRIGNIDLSLSVRGKPIECLVTTVPRTDVTLHFPDAEERDLGFVLLTEAGSGNAVTLCWKTGGIVNEAPLSIADVNEIDEAAMSTLGPVRMMLVRQLVPGSTDWKKLMPAPSTAASAHARGFLESAVVISPTGRALVSGWVVGEPTAQFWLENDRADVFPLAGASWRARPDVMESMGYQFGADALDSGFVVYLESVGATEGMVLKAMSSQGVHILHAITSNQMPADPVAVSRWLFGISVTAGELLMHHSLVEEPILSTLIEHAQNSWDRLPQVVRQLGVVPYRPSVSLIVPLFGRYDFVESQMLEWVRDPWLLANAELIYVIDDPSLEQPFRLHAEELHRLYRVPFKWVWGCVNRGFSGANNLGAKSATADYLLFLNSDVFPCEPGWIEPLLDVLKSRPDIGAIGPRLVFAEGGIQHAGMVFERLEEYSVWINRHPYLGLDPSLDPHTQLTEAPAITGACLLMRRQDFDSVEGWDSGYLIGDFEDSDLCLKLRSAGLSVAYLPSVQMIHLERQSMTVLGSGDYRMRVTLWNAMRHQRRWGELLANLGEVKR